MYPDTFIRHFWSLVDRSGGPRSCWPWLAAQTNGGYGVISFDGKLLRANRVAWEIEQGRPMPKGLEGAHSCDDPPCCNPAHIEPKTHKQNGEDMERRKRSASGHRHGMAKLTNSDVLEIKRLWAAGGRSQKAIGAMFGVRDSCISRILNGKRWGGIAC